jgi:predicted nuclease of predicted toxin-antitoxin system
MATMRFYFDEMMPRPVANELIKRGFDVIMAVDVEMTGKDDPEHLKYATEQGRVLVTQDRGFAGRSSKQTNHAGVICWIGTADDFGGQIRAFSAFGEQYEPEQVSGQTFWLK